MRSKYVDRLVDHFVNIDVRDEVVEDSDRLWCV